MTETNGWLESVTLLTFPISGRIGLFLRFFSFFLERWNDSDTFKFSHLFCTLQSIFEGSQHRFFLVRIISKNKKNYSEKQRIQYFYMHIAILSLLSLDSCIIWCIFYSTACKRIFKYYKFFLSVDFSKDSAFFSCDYQVERLNRCGE